MRTLWPAALSQLHHRGQESTDWRADVQRYVSRGSGLGLSRDEIIAQVARRLYDHDLEELGCVLDLGLLSWEIYLGDAGLIVDDFLHSEPSRFPSLKGSRRSA